jgi:hypothetical protein
MTANGSCSTRLVRDVGVSDRDSQALRKSADVGRRVRVHRRAGGRRWHVERGARAGQQGRGQAAAVRTVIPAEAGIQVDTSLEH